MGFRSNLTEVDKQVLFHEHEVKRARFFNDPQLEQEHKQALDKLKTERLFTAI